MSHVDTFFVLTNIYIKPPINNKMKKSELKQLIKEEIEKVLNEAKKTFKLKIINKSGPATIQQVSADTGTTELFDIVALIKKSPKVKDVKILED